MLKLTIPKSLQSHLLVKKGHLGAPPRQISISLCGYFDIYTSKPGPGVGPSCRSTKNFIEPFATRRRRHSRRVLNDLLRVTLLVILGYPARQGRGPPLSSPLLSSLHFKSFS